MRAKIPRLTEALTGRFADHHAIVARRIIDHVAFLDRAISLLSTDIADLAAVHQAAIDLLGSIPGVKKATAEIFIAETAAI
jgi:transposase